MSNLLPLLLGITPTATLAENESANRLINSMVGRVEVMADAQGHWITPSWVSFTEEERLLGDSANNAHHSNPQNTVLDAKRLIGRKMDEADLKKDMKHWPFGVIIKAGEPQTEMEFKNEKCQFVSTPLFRRLSWN